MHRILKFVMGPSGLDSVLLAQGCVLSCGTGGEGRLSSRGGHRLSKPL